MRPRRCLPLLALALAGAAASAQDAPPPVAPPPAAEADPVVVPADAWEGVERVPLRLVHRFAEGALGRYQVRQRVEVDAGGQRQCFDQCFVVGRHVVEAPAGGPARLRETYEAVAFAFELGGKALALDTRDGTTSGNPVIDAMAAMVGASIESRVALDGRVEAVEGGAALLERVVAATPDAAKEVMRKNLSQSLSDATLTQQLQESLVVFPDRELAPGDGWRRTATASVPNVGELEYVFDYVLLGAVERPAGRCAKLLARVRSPGCAARETVVNGAPATIAVDAFEATAAVIVRLADGAPVEAGPQVLAMTLTIAVQGQSVVVANTTTTRSELLPGKAAEPEPPTAPEPAAPR